MLYAICVAAMLLVGPPEAAKPAVDIAHEKWEALARGVKPGDSLRKKVEEARGFVPHLTPEGWSSVGGSDYCKEWSGTVFALDRDWSIVRYATAETNIAPPPPDVPVVVRIVGLPDLKDSIKPELYEAVSVIHRSPSMFDFDPVNLIDAVNYLHAMGEEKALEALQAYAAVCQTPCRAWHRLDADRIFLIARLLYVPADPGSPIRAPGLGAAFVQVAGGHEIGALFPLVLHLDVPFHVNTGYVIGGGPPEDPMDYVRHCRRVGKFRAAPLKPSPDPIGAAQRLIDSGRLAGLKTGVEGSIDMIRSQALDAAGNVIGDPKKWSPSGRCTDAEWTRVVQVSRNAQPRWDAAAGDFVASKPVK